MAVCGAARVLPLKNQIFNYLEKDAVMIVEIEGVVEVAGDTQTFGNKGYKKRTLVVKKKDADWIQLFPVDLVKDDCDKVIQVGDEITAECYVNGSRKLWKDRAFVSLTVRDINIKGQQNDSQAPTEAPF
jgi:hypothetical protein